MRVKIVKAVRVAGKDHHPGDVPDFDDDTAHRLVEQGYGVKAQSEGIPPLVDFEGVGDISEVLPTGGEGEQFAIDDLIGVPIVILGARFDKGRSGRLAGKDIATIQFAKKDVPQGWFTTWSSPLIAQVKQLEELKALPRRCMIKGRQGGSGYTYYILTSASAKSETKKEV